MSSASSTSVRSSVPAKNRTAGPVFLYLAGVGDVGSAFLRQLDDRSNPSGPALRLVGACNSRRSTWTPDGLAPRATSAHVSDGAPLDWNSIQSRLARDAPRPLIFVDATGSPDVAARYETLFRAGIHVVTPSKLANARAQSAFDRLQAAAAEQGVHYRYETAVGAGLPIVQTVKDLVDTGDRIRAIRGAVSGTLTFIFSELRGGASFDAAVRTAMERGYAEPDVRDDLSGEDVARKFLILARTIGHSVNRADVHVESLVPEPLRDLSYETFLGQVDTVNETWQRRMRAAEAGGAVLQYVGELSDDGINVGVRCVPDEGAFGQLSGQNNLFEIRTDRYAESPLMVRGPGAGPEVTAAGVLADVLKVARAVTDTVGGASAC